MQSAPSGTLSWRGSLSTVDPRPGQLLPDYRDQLQARTATPAPWP